MPPPICIKVCKKCAWDEKKVHRVMRDLEEAHPGRIVVQKKGCLDRCKKDPVVVVNKTLVAPAKPKRLRAVIETALR